jgi:hypothetical protein
MKSLTRRQIPLLVALGLLLLLAVAVAHADLKATAVVYAWDIKALKYQNSNVIIDFDGSWVPFVHELNFDNDVVTQTCPSGLSTKWAGTMYYGLYHEDDAPDGGAGFQQTRDWQLIECDRDGDDDFDGGDLALQPPYSVTLYTPDSMCIMTPGEVCQLIEQDRVITCTVGNCKTEIETEFFINLDADCDGTPDVPIPPSGLCFYAEAKTPPNPPDPYTYPFWSGPLQARISTVGGEKTVNFKPQPTAARLSSFQATAGDGAVLLAWQTADEVGLTGFNVWRNTRSTGPGQQLNDLPIQPLSPGSLLGRAYTYRDDTAACDLVASYGDGPAVCGTTYYYWLEVLEVGGRRTWYGPTRVDLSTFPVPPATRPLPGRPRPGLR